MNFKLGYIWCYVYLRKQTIASAGEMHVKNLKNLYL